MKGRSLRKKSSYLRNWKCPSGNQFQNICFLREGSYILFFAIMIHEEINFKFIFPNQQVFRKDYSSLCIKYNKKIIFHANLHKHF